MFAFDMATASDLLQIIWLDVVLSGDNALVIGMAAAALAPHLQRKAILFGMILATLIRIVAAMAATTLYGVPWVKFVGGVALLWVAWKLWVEARALNCGDEPAAQSLSAAAVDPPTGATDRRSIMKALMTITVADVSMSIDNVLAVAGVAHGNQALLIFGLALSIFLMAFFATMICRFLVRNPWISFVGVAVLVYVGAEMIWSSWPDMRVFIGLD